MVMSQCMLRTPEVNNGTLVEPRYLEAMSLLMSKNMSTPEAIKALYIVDTKIWGQTQHLPLKLDK